LHSTDNRYKQSWGSRYSALDATFDILIDALLTFHGKFSNRETTWLLALLNHDMNCAIALSSLLSIFTDMIRITTWTFHTAWLSCVSTNQEKMQKWAEYTPMNYLHKFHLVEAEKARVLGQFLEAEEFYGRAIAGAAENEFIQEEALAYELAAKHYLARG